MRVIGVPVFAPLPDVAVHLVESPRVRRQRADRQWALTIGARRAARVGEAAMVVDLVGGHRAAEGERCRRAGAAGILPFGFSWQPRVHSRQPPVEFADETLRVVPGDVLDRIAGIVLEMTRIDRPDRHPECLRAGRVGDPEAPTEGDFVQQFGTAALRLVGGRPHQEAAGAKPAEGLPCAADGEGQGEPEIVLDMPFGAGYGERYSGCVRGARGGKFGGGHRSASLRLAELPTRRVFVAGPQRALYLKHSRVVRAFLTAGPSPTRRRPICCAGGAWRRPLSPAAAGRCQAAVVACACRRSMSSALR
ncbi:MAG: hypothetical protein AW07_04427 [Candidatus Accumulibacter sp. SK-11]|nr:MAG: hypothetical protein AW07_04427 [Candidatus Accumulibacter sp. SK-11]